MGQTVHNWNHSVVSTPSKVEIARTLDKLVEIVRDQDNFPSPIRVAGNRHSTTECFVTTGTQVFFEGEFFKKCELSPDQKFLTGGAGVTMWKIKEILQLQGLQLAVMPEVGNATAGSVACCGTKDSSFNGSPSQVSSTVLAVKMVKADGTLESVDVRKGADEEARMRLIRSSYGLLGIIYEVTFKTEPLTVALYTYEVLTLDPLPPLARLRNGDNNALLGYMQPYNNQILVERRTLVPNIIPTKKDRSQIKIRSDTWGFKAVNLTDFIGTADSTLGSIFPDLSAKIFNKSRTKIVKILSEVLNGFRASRADCMIVFEEEGPFFDFTFSAFPVKKWGEVVPRYLDFVRQFEKDNRGFQTSLFTEVYLISKDDASFLTFSPDEDIFTLDMVHHDAADPDWREMNRQFNVFAAKHGGLPVLNQTKELTTSPPIAGKSVIQATLGNRWLEFMDIVRAEDPKGRFMNEFFRKL